MDDSLRSQPCPRQGPRGLDIRIPIGLLFWITGLLLVVYGLFSDPAIYARSLGYNVNLYWGAILAVFGGVMLLLARLGARRGKTSARAAAGSGSPPKASSG